MKRSLIKKLAILLLAILVGLTVFAQQEVMYTQYMFNGLAINPAYAGSHETISMSALVREQWKGMEGAPRTQTFSLHSPVKNQRMALGLLAIHDEIGVTEQAGVHLSYAYRIPVSDKGKLSFGLKSGVSYFSANYTQLGMDDIAFSEDINEYHPTVGFGMYFETERFYAGISSPQLLEKDLIPNAENMNVARHYFGTIGYLIDLSPQLKLKPSALIKSVPGAPLQLDLNSNLLISDVIWVGLSYRSFESVDALLQLQVSNQLQIGYSWDFATSNEMRSLNSGSHEFMLHYRFSFNRTKVINPRYF